MVKGLQKRSTIKWPCRMLLILLAALTSPFTAPFTAAAGRPQPPQRVREIFVPFDDLNVILESDVRRVFLTRDQYEQLLKQVRTSPDEKPPLGALVVSAEYKVNLEPGRARIIGSLQVEVLDDGLQLLRLPFSGVGIRRASIDESPAALARDEGGQVSLFVSGRGQHTLSLELIAVLQTTAAVQSLNIQIPTPASTQLQIVAPGNVEVKSGAAVAHRELIDGATHLELSPPRGPLAIVMSLNNRAQQTRQVVVARGVIVDEVTQGYERLHARISMNVLHGETQEFRFGLPDGFEVNQVRSPLLAQWVVATEGEQRVLTTQLRQPESGTVSLDLALVKTTASLKDWQMPQLVPLDVASYVAVVGLVAEQRIDAKQITASGLIPIDNKTLTSSIPQSVFEADPGAPTIRPVVTYYAPQAEYSLKAQFVEPPAQHQVASNLMLTVADSQLALRAGFTVVPTAERLFELRIDVPAGWHVTAVTGGDQQPLPYEQVPGEAGSMLRIRFPSGAPVQSPSNFYVDAVAVPDKWLDDWKQNKIEFPAFAVRDAQQDAGAVSVTANDDLIVRPDQLEGLTPLDRADAVKYGLENVSLALAYRYDRQPYRASLAIQRREPWVTARNYSFLTVLPDSLRAHYEVDFLVSEAAVRELVLRLPLDTPDSLSIRGLDGVQLKEFSSDVVDNERRWTVLLAQRRRGRIRLGVDFQQRLVTQEPKDLSLPLIAADNVAFQSGHVAVEGSPELDVQIATTARPVDVGELSDADYLPGRRLLGAHAYAGSQTDIKINVFRHPGYALPSAIVERAEMVTAISASGVSQTVARYDLKTKASYIEIELPQDAKLWSALLDGVPTKPQRDDQRLLLSLPAKTSAGLRKLQVVYETPSSAIGLIGTVDLAAPKLYLRAAPDQPRAEVPVADVGWHVNLPAGYRIARSEGTVFTSQVQQRRSPLATVVQTMYTLAGGAHPFYMHIASQSVRESARQVVVDESGSMRSYGYAEGEQGLDERKDNEWKLTDIAPASERNITLGPRPDDPEDEPAASSDGAVDGVVGGAVDGTTDGTAGSGRVQFGVGGNQDAGLAGPPADQAQPPGPEKPQRGDGRKVPARRGGKYSSGWALEGVSSLMIDVKHSGNEVLFQSLGADPQLRATLIQDQRVQSLAWAVGLAIFLIGVLLSRRSVGTRIRYIVVVVLISSLLPLLTGWTNQFGDLFDLAFFAACLLIPFYLVVGAFRWYFRQMFGARAAIAKHAVAAASLLALLTLAGGADAEPPIVVQIAPPPAPVKVPRDAIIVPYQPSDDVPIDQSIREAKKVLVPYDKYVELWNQAHPDQKIAADEPVVQYALSGGEFTARLEGEDFLLVHGRLHVDLYVDRVVSVPLALDGGVLAKAQLDDKPARMQFVEPTAAPPGANAPNASPLQSQRRAAPNQAAAPQIAQSDNQQGPPQRKGLVVLLVSGKGRHQLDVSIRMPLTRQGGWRRLSGHVPAPPAAALTLDVPQANSEVRLPGVLDRPSQETTQANEKIETVLGANGLLHVQWRPQVEAGVVDRSLTAKSQAVFDVRTDGLLLLWQLTVDFGRTQREAFTIDVPAGYLIERINGENVRGWTARDAQDRQQVEINLLKAVQGRQSVTVQLARHESVGADPKAEFDVPLVSVSGAALHRGQLTVRRSPILELQTVQRAGVTRQDASAKEAVRVAAAVGAEESPLGIHTYQAFQFVTTPFRVRLSARRITAETSATVQSIVRVARRETTLESLVRYQVKGRPVYQLSIALPADLDLKNQVRAPEPFQWSVTEQDGNRVLHIYLGAGQQGNFPVFIGGSLPSGTNQKTGALPRLVVQDVGRQEGDIVIQIDPAFDVRAANLQQCESVLPQRVHGWLVERRQRELARLVLRYRGGDYQGSLLFTQRQPRVSCRTISNTRITENTIEETILLDFTIRDAGIRQAVFLLPESMKDARISAPELRQTTITPVDGQPLVRVQLDLQDDIMGQLRVKILHDRLLAGASHPTPIPVVETGQTERRYVILENAGRDELEIEQRQGLEPLSRQQQEWRELAQLMGNQLTHAYIVRKGFAAAQLTFATRERKAVQTARASIGLARASVIVDGSGTYRGVQEFRLDNETEQFLEIELPAGASLWSASVADASVKPIEAAGSQGKLQIPLIKTAKGDRDYAIVLKYGGTLDALSNLGTVSFPLVRTINIKPETSQVRLHLPKTHQWFDFGGEMTQVAEEVLAAGEVAYITRQINKFAEVLRSTDGYSQSRAKANSKSLLEEQQRLEHRQSQLGGGNEQLNTTYSLNQRAVENFQQQLKNTEQRASEEIVDNRGRLDKAWGGQRNDRASDVVNEIDDNFDYDQELSRSRGRGKDIIDLPSGETGNGFNQEWLEKNSLGNAGIATKSDGTRYQVDPAIPDSDLYSRGHLQGKKGKPAPPPPQVTAGNKIQAPLGLPGSSLNLKDGQQGDQGTFGLDGKGEETEREEGSVKNRAKRYQEKLENQQVAQQGQISENAQDQGNLNGRDEEGRRVGDFDDRLALGSGQTATLPASQTAYGNLPGMASLDVEFPSRGELYLFSTPRGDARVTARSMSRPLLNRLKALAWVVGVVVLSLVVIRWIRGGGLTALRGRRGGVTLIVLGIASLLTFVFPVAGLLAILIGAVLMATASRSAVKTA